MAVVETDKSNGVMTIRMNRPERLNALGVEMRAGLTAAWRDLRDDPAVEVAILTGTGRGFCAGEDMKESLERGTAGTPPDRTGDPYYGGEIDKPIIAAVNGYAMGGGFTLAERADLRVAVRGAIFEMSEAKRWLLGGYNHGLVGGLSHTFATEMAFAFRFDAVRLYEMGFINRICDDEEALMATANDMARHLLSLPPASRVNTLTMMRAMRPSVPAELEALAEQLKNHGARSDLMESRAAFAEKRPPQFKGWDHPEDRANTPRLSR